MPPPETPSSFELKERDLAIESTSPVTDPVSPIEDDRPASISARVARKTDFGFIPIPKSKRHDPNLKVHEQFAFTWRMNLILAGAAVRTLVEVHRG